MHGEAKTYQGLGRAVRRGPINMQIQAYIVASVINLKRLATVLLRFALNWRAQDWPPSPRMAALAPRFVEFHMEAT